MSNISSRPEVLGAALSVDSINGEGSSLAAFDPSGCPLGTRVYVRDSAVGFRLVKSSATVDHSKYEAVLNGDGTTRWISDNVGTFTTVSASGVVLAGGGFGLSITNTSASEIAATKAVAIGSDGKPIVADSTDGTLPPIGMTIAAAAAGAVMTLVTHGKAAGVLSGATPGARYYLGTGGALTVTKPVTAGHAVVVVGYALSATDLFVAISDQGVVAA